jgi:hypothetical protein
MQRFHSRVDLQEAKQTHLDQRADRVNGLEMETYLHSMITVKCRICVPAMSLFRP